jgi:hypothetical protein
MHALQSDLGYELASDSFKQVRAAENVDDDTAMNLIWIVQSDGSKSQFIDYSLILSCADVKVDRLIRACRETS